jgi:hypothetical protein
MPPFDQALTVFDGPARGRDNVLECRSISSALSAEGT